MKIIDNTNHSLEGCCTECNEGVCTEDKMQCNFTRCTKCNEDDSTIEGENKLNQRCNK